MAVLSNNGRLITSLPVSNQASDDDELLIQSGGVTKRIKYSTLKTNFLTGFNPYTSVVDFTALTNKFTGSLKGTSTGVKITLTTNDGIQGGGELTSNRTLSVDNTVVRTSGNQTIGGTKTFSSTIAGNLSGNVTSTGTSTFTTADINGGTIDGTTIGSSSPSTIIGTRITGSIGIRGNVTGSVRGDIYTANGDKVLENGTSANPGGNVPSAFFYGTSSYASQALTAAFSNNSVASNGLPTGGTQYQVLNKTSGTDYQVGWVNPITRSGAPSVNDITLWNDGRTLVNAPGFTYDGSSTYTINSKDLHIYGDIRIFNAGNGITGSLRGDVRGVITSPYDDGNIISSGDTEIVLRGDLYPIVLLELSSSGNVTMSLKNGQRTDILIKNEGAYDVSKWSGSLDDGATANTNILWSAGTQPSVTSGNLKKDLFSFINIADNIIGYARSDIKGKV